MGKEQYHPTTSGLPSKETLKKWGIRLGLIAIGILGLVWIL